MHELFPPRRNRRPNGTKRIGGFAFVVALIMLFLAVGVSWALYEVSLVCAGIAVFCLYLHWIINKGYMELGIAVVLFLLSYVVIWGVGLIGYRYVLPLVGFNSLLTGTHFVKSALLVLIAFCGTTVGAAIMHNWSGPRRGGAPDRPVLDSEKDALLLWFGLLYVIYQCAAFSVLGFNARAEHGSFNEAGSAPYFIVGLRTISYPFYFFIGMCMGRHLLSLRSLVLTTITLACIIFMAFTGGRTLALEPLITVLIAASFSKLSSKNLIVVWVVGGALTALIIIAVGLVRGSDVFATGSLAEKTSEARRVLKGGVAAGNEYDSPVYLLFSRLYEPTGQIVIDSIVENRNYVGFINCERILTAFLPRVIYLNKKPLTDGGERLMAYGIYGDNFTQAPLTLVADSFERFGEVGVLGVHILIGMLLAWVAHLIRRVRDGVLRLLLLLEACRIVIFLYPESALGVVHYMVYGLLRDAIIIAVAYLLGRIVVRQFSKLGAVPVRRTKRQMATGGHIAG